MLIADFLNDAKISLLRSGHRTSKCSIQVGQTIGCRRIVSRQQSDYVVTSGKESGYLSFLQCGQNVSAAAVQFRSYISEKAARLLPGYFVFTSTRIDHRRRERTLHLASAQFPFSLGQVAAKRSRRQPHRHESQQKRRKQRRQANSPTPAKAVLPGRLFDNRSIVFIGHIFTPEKFAFSSN